MLELKKKGAMEREQQALISGPHGRNVSVTGTACLSDGAKAQVLVRDLSYKGCKLLCAKIVKVGDTIKLTVPGLGTIDAQVRWTADDKAGLSFLLGIRST